MLKILSGMTNNVDPDQATPSGAVWSGSALFAYIILSDTLVFEILGHEKISREMYLHQGDLKLNMHTNMLPLHWNLQTLLKFTNNTIMTGGVSRSYIWAATSENLPSDLSDAKIKISLYIHAVWPESSLCTFWIAKDAKFFMQKIKILISQWDTQTDLRHRSCTSESMLSLVLTHFFLYLHDW